MSWFVYVIWVSGDELSMDEPATERKSPERQFVVRDHVMRACRSLPKGGVDLAFPR